jgi:hypothetical protein
MRCPVLTVNLARKLRRIANDMLESSEDDSVVDELHDKYGIKIPRGTDRDCLHVLHNSLTRLPPDLVRDCGITSMDFKDMGPSRKYYPNHGVYSNGTLTLNSNIIDDKHTLEFDPKSGECLNKFDQTFFHELGHGWDEAHGDGVKELSIQPEWLGISGWSEKPKDGLKKLVIDEKGAPHLEGEWWYDPNAGFTRFYAKRNPLDDWADSFSYYVGGLKSFLPKKKVEYFDKAVGKYFSN